MKNGMFNYIDNVVNNSHRNNENYIFTYFHYFDIENDLGYRKENNLRFLKRNRISGGRSRLQIRDINGNRFDFTDIDIIEILSHEKNKKFSEKIKKYLLDISSKNYSNSNPIHFQLFNEHSDSKKFTNNLVDSKFCTELKDKTVFFPKSHTNADSISFYLLISIILYKEQCFEEVSKKPNRMINQAFIFYYLSEYGIESIKILSEKSNRDSTKEPRVQISNLIKMDDNLYEIISSHQII